MHNAQKIIQFNSKRNDVWLCKGEESRFVEKVFCDEKCYTNEKQIYEKLKLSKQKLCPRLIKSEDNCKTLIIEHIDGATLLEELEREEKQNNVDNAHKLLIKLFKWLECFHLQFENQIMMNDVNLRNFILYEDSIFGVDFEMCKKEDVQTDYLYAVAIYMLYNPVDSRFKAAVFIRLYESYFRVMGYTLEQFNLHVDEQISIIKKRRKTKIS